MAQPAYTHSENAYIGPYNNARYNCNNHYQRQITSSDNQLQNSHSNPHYQHGQQFNYSQQSHSNQYSHSNQHYQQPKSDQTYLNAHKHNDNCNEKPVLDEYDKSQYVYVNNQPQQPPTHHHTLSPSKSNCGELTECKFDQFGITPSGYYESSSDDDDEESTNSDCLSTVPANTSCLYQNDYQFIKSATTKIASKVWGTHTIIPRKEITFKTFDDLTMSSTSRKKELEAAAKSQYHQLFDDKDYWKISICQVIRHIWQLMLFIDFTSKSWKKDLVKTIFDFMMTVRFGFPIDCNSAIDWYIYMIMLKLKGKGNSTTYSSSNFVVVELRAKIEEFIKNQKKQKDVFLRGIYLHLYMYIYIYIIY